MRVDEQEQFKSDPSGSLNLRASFNSYLCPEMKTTYLRINKLLLISIGLPV